MSSSRFTSISGLTSIRRMPRLGKIRLGIRVPTKKGDNEYPKEVEYFVVPEEVTEALEAQKAKALEAGDERYRDLDPAKPTWLPIFFTSDDRERVFPQRLQYYRASGLFCQGDGVTAMRVANRKDPVYGKEIPKDVEEGTFYERPCLFEDCPDYSCEKPRCKRIGRLYIGLHFYPSDGVFEIATSSWNSIVDLNSAIENVQEKTAGALRYLFDMETQEPLLVLRRVKTPVMHGGKTTTHYTLRLESSVSVPYLMGMLAERRKTGLLPPPSTHPEAHDDLPEDLYPAAVSQPAGKPKEKPAAAPKPKSKPKPKPAPTPAPQAQEDPGTGSEDPFITGEGDEGDGFGPPPESAPPADVEAAPAAAASAEEEGGNESEWF